jgi:hypothetical protein
MTDLVWPGNLRLGFSSTVILVSGTRVIHVDNIFIMTHTRVFLKTESESELVYDCRFTANQFVLATSPLRPTTSNLLL